MVKRLLRQICFTVIICQFTLGGNLAFGADRFSDLKKRVCDYSMFDSVKLVKRVVENFYHDINQSLVSSARGDKNISQLFKNLDIQKLEIAKTQYAPFFANPKPLPAELLPKTAEESAVFWKLFFNQRDSKSYDLVMNKLGIKEEIEAVVEQLPDGNKLARYIEKMDFPNRMISPAQIDDLVKVYSQAFLKYAYNNPKSSFHHYAKGWMILFSHKKIKAEQFQELLLQANLRQQWGAQISALGIARENNLSEMLPRKIFARGLKYTISAFTIISDTLNLANRLKISAEDLVVINNIISRYGQSKAYSLILSKFPQLNRSLNGKLIFHSLNSVLLTMGVTTAAVTAGYYIFGEQNSRDRQAMKLMDELAIISIIQKVEELNNLLEGEKIDIGELKTKLQDMSKDDLSREFEKMDKQIEVARDKSEKDYFLKIAQEKYQQLYSYAQELKEIDAIDKTRFSIPAPVTSEVLNDIDKLQSANIVWASYISLLENEISRVSLEDTIRAQNTVIKDQFKDIDSNTKEEEKAKLLQQLMKTAEEFRESEEFILVD